MLLNSKLIFSSLLFMTLLACKKEENKPSTTSTSTTPTTPVNTMVKLGETYIIGARAKAVVYTPQALLRGYNLVYVALYDSLDGTRLSNGHFHIDPMMDMGSMQHSTPVENSEDTVTTNGYFRSAVVFSMPGDSSEWKLNMHFHNHKIDKEGEGTIGVNVVETSPARFRNPILAADTNANIYISYISPSAPKVGINDFEIVMHKRISNNVYLSVENYSVEIVPEMPSMGHGSPNNVNPVHIGNGHYTGKVNFTMTGLWRINLKLYKNGTLISSDQYFEVTLQ